MIAYDFIKLHVFVFWLYFRTKIYYLTSKKDLKFTKGFYYVYLNHCSLSDPLIIYSALWYKRGRGLGTKELFNGFFANLFYKAAGTIPLDKENLGTSTLKEIKKGYENDRPIYIFPEGHIQEDNQIGEFKVGVARFALSIKGDFIPCYIEKRTSKFKRQNIMFGRRLDIDKLIDNNKTVKENALSISKNLRECLINLKISYNNIKREENLKKCDYLYIKKIEYDLKESMLPQNLDQYKKYKDKKQYNQSLNGWYFLYTILKEKFYTDLKDYTILCNEDNKPFIKELPNLCFNISHSAKIVVIAISTNNIGVDVEIVNERKNITKLQDKMIKMDKVFENKNFFAAWTIYEAKFKYGNCSSNLNKTFTKMVKYKKDSYYISVVAKKDKKIKIFNMIDK
jgi:4'-phosphopantetheinyl transferase